MKTLKKEICERLKIDDFRFVEIESKKRVLSSEAKPLKNYLKKHPKIKHAKSSYFFDQFLDTPQMTLLKKGASLRIRYKGGGSRIYLQYKGPGYIEDGILFRSEFSSHNLQGLILEESHHDIIHFNQTSIRKIIARHISHPMKKAMKVHLGTKTISQISRGPIISLYKKDKFLVRIGKAFLEPSLDQIFAFHISKTDMHPLSTFWEFENEVKSKANPGEKIGLIPTLLEFNEKIEERFKLKAEHLDKYHRCASIFLPRYRFSRTVP